MARKKKSTLNLGTLLGTAFVLLLVSLLINVVGSSDISLIVVTLGIVVIALVYSSIILPNQRRNEMLNHVDAVANAHIDALIRQQAILIRCDAYGKPVYDKWQAEVNYFVAQHVRPALKPRLWTLLDRDKEAISQRIMQRVAAVSQTRPALATLLVNMTPAGFEAYCAESLRACGWAVSLTPLCRDQGVDVIAEKNGVRMVIQCKLYSNPVGNKAVQEIAAGRVHQQAHCAAVVTNNTYTEAAKQLATSNGIWLLHHTDLPNLEGMLFRPVAQREYSSSR